MSEFGSDEMEDEHGPYLGVSTIFTFSSKTFIIKAVYLILAPTKTLLCMFFHRSFIEDVIF